MRTNYSRFTFVPAALALVTACAHAFAQSGGQTYPTAPVRIVVPFPAGGGVDTTARLAGQKLAEALGKQFIIDNRPGANGMIGSEIVAKSPRDGYTLMVNGANFVTTPSLYSKVTYDPIRDFEPVSLLSFAPNVLVVHPSLPFAKWARVIKRSGARVD